ncbi:MAG: hypothetical protein WCC10_09405 [Tumebacillaceae bacterium]
MSDHFDNSDWQLGMSLPSRKETHSKKKNSKDKHKSPSAPVAPREPEPPRRELNLQPERALTLEPEKKPLRESARELDLKIQPESSTDLQPLRPKIESVTPAQESQWQAETVSNAEQSQVQSPPLQAEPGVDNVAASAELAQARAEVATATALSGNVTEEERDMLWGDDEDGPILTRWQRLLLFVVVPVVILGVIVWGKIAYVHHVPQLVRDNVPAYASGEGFLVVKPWWFGPPVYELGSYPQANDFPMYQTRMGDHAPLVDDPFVLWRFQQDILSN